MTNRESASKIKAYTFPRSFWRPCLPEMLRSHRPSLPIHQVTAEVATHPSIQRDLIIIATYNEVGNLRSLITSILTLVPSLDVLVVDDNSPDGTGELADSIATDHAGVYVLHRCNRTGLAAALSAGFRWGLAAQYARIANIDGDFSHNPADIAHLISSATNGGLVIGSRYINGIRVINWPLKRLVLSLGGAWYVKLVTGMAISDPGSGFRCFTRRALETALHTHTVSKGYSVHLEMTHTVWAAGLPIIETPIFFADRTQGRTKLTTGIVLEALWVTVRLLIRTRFRRYPKLPSASAPAQAAGVGAGLSSTGRAITQLLSEPPRAESHRATPLRAPPACRGFTLVELLTVVAVIFLLTGLLISSLSSISGKVRGLQCLSNNRQLVLSWHMYADDTGQLLPNMDGMGSVPILTNWVAGSVAISTDARDAEILVNPRRSLIASYVRDSKLFKCPADESPFARSVSMNSRLNPTRPDGPPSWIGGKGTNYEIFRDISGILHPARVMVIVDERSDSINDSYFAVDLSNTGSAVGDGAVQPFFMIDFPASYHNGAATVSFADGHLETHRWLEKTSRPAVGRLRHASHTSAVDRDVSWLQSHSSYPK